MAGECTGGLHGSHKSHQVACGRRHHKVTGMGMYPAWRPVFINKVNRMDRMLQLSGCMQLAESVFEK